MSINIDLESSQDDLFDDGKKKKKRKMFGVGGPKKDQPKETPKEKDKDKKVKHKKVPSSTTSVVLSTSSSQPTPGVPTGPSLSTSDNPTLQPEESLLADNDSMMEDVKAAKKSHPLSPTKPVKEKEKDKEKKLKTKMHSSTPKLRPVSATGEGPPAPTYVPAPPIVKDPTSTEHRAGLSAEATIVMSRRKQGANTNPSRVGPSAESALVMKERKKKYNTLPSDLPSTALNKIGRSESDEQLEDSLPKTETVGEMERLPEPGTDNYQRGAVTHRPEDSAKMSKLEKKGQRATTPLTQANLQVSLKVEYKGKTVSSVDVGLVSLPTLTTMAAHSIGVDLDFVRSICLGLRLEYFIDGDYVELSDDNLSIIYQANTGLLRTTVVDEE